MWADLGECVTGLPKSPICPADLRDNKGRTSVLRSAERDHVQNANTARLSAVRFCGGRSPGPSPDPSEGRSQCHSQGHGPGQSQNPVKVNVKVDVEVEVEVEVRVKIKVEVEVTVDVEVC